MFKSLKHVLGKWKRNFFDERTYDDLIEDIHILLKIYMQILMKYLIQL